MVVRINLLDKYPLTIRDQDMQYVPDARHSERGYFWFVTHKPNDVTRQAACLERIITGLPQLGTAVEFFGGIGMCSIMIHEILQPTRHLIYDIDPFCARHLKHLTRNWKGVEVRQGNVFDAPLSKFEQAQFFSFDFNQFTIMDLNGRLAVIDKLSAVITSVRPRYVQITDSAVNKLHLNLERYGSIAGMKMTNIQDYIQGFSGLAYRRWKYSATRAYYHFGASYILLEPGRHRLKELEKIK